MDLVFWGRGRKKQQKNNQYFYYELVICAYMEVPSWHQQSPIYLKTFLRALPSIVLYLIILIILSFFIIFTGNIGDLHFLAGL